MADSNYNGYTWKQREKILSVLSRKKRDGFQPRQGPCDMCGDPGKQTNLHSEDYSEPFTFEPPQTYLLCKACHLRLHKRFNDAPENWALFLSHLRAGGYGAEFSKLYPVAQRKEWAIRLEDGDKIELPPIRQRQLDPVPWWELLTLDAESKDAAWARPRPLRPRPALEAFREALETVYPSTKELALLRCHASCEKHSATMRHLARHALDSEKPSTANLIYGSLARRLCETISDWKPDTREDGTPIWMSIVAEGWQPKSREFEWVLIPELRKIFGEVTDQLAASKKSEGAFQSKTKASRIGVKDSSGKLTDIPFHEEILNSIDDSALRLRSAQKAVEKFGFTPEQAETIFNVKMPKA